MAESAKVPRRIKAGVKLTGPGKSGKRANAIAPHHTDSSQIAPQLGRARLRRRSLLVIRFGYIQPPGAHGRLCLSRQIIVPTALC